MRSSKSVTYEIDYPETTFRVLVEITSDQDEGCWTSYDGSPGTPPSESRDFVIELITDIDEDGNEKDWTKPSRHPLYWEIKGEVGELVRDEEINY